jgi:hypothetical protein
MQIQEKSNKNFNFRQQNINITRKLIELVIAYVPSEYWNTCSILLALVSKPTIGSPIKFQGEKDENLMVQEFAIGAMSEHTFEKFLLFCYPPDMLHRDQEIEIDKRVYWQHASVFLVIDNKENIIACVMYIDASNGTILPIGNGIIALGNGEIGKCFSVAENAGNHSAAEIYRLRRSFAIGRKQVIPVVNMIFKAIWAKAVQSRADYLYCTVEETRKELIGIYEKRLNFEDIKVTLCYGDGSTLWKAYRMNCAWHDKKYATVSKDKFLLQTYVRSNLSQILLTKRTQRMLWYADRARSFLSRLFSRN